MLSQTIQNSNSQLDANIADMNEYFEAIEDQRRYWARQQSLYNKFELKKWGIYNCDRVFNEPAVAREDVDIKFKGSDNINGATLYVLYDSINSVITHSLMDNYYGRDVTLYQDYDGQIEMFILANNGDFFSK